MAMRFKTLDAEATFALRAVTHAARLCRRLEIEGAPAASKADRSPVTAADFAAQAVVGGLLQEAFPADGVVAEEDSRLLLNDISSDRLNAVVEAVRAVIPEATAEQVRRWIDRGGSPAGRFWALDPLDGTKGFLRDGQYAVALALLEEGQVVLGAIACPKLSLAAPRTGGSGQVRGSREGEGTVALAVRGGGAFAAPMGVEVLTRLRVSPVDDAGRARLLRSFEADHTDVAKLDEIAGLLGVQAPPVRMDSQAKSVLLAAGEGELIVRLLSPRHPDYAEKIWDQAAGALLVEEAGGRVTDLTGARLDFSAGRTLDRNLGVVASNGVLHDAALEAIHRAGADRRPENPGNGLGEGMRGRPSYPPH
jgi:3'(2'), 5'-bisphosphate nucleotidase